MFGATEKKLLAYLRHDLFENPCLKIQVYNSQKDLLVSKQSVCALVKEILKLERSDHQEATVYFVSVKEICKLHEDFFSDGKQTDCISFPLDKQHLGEIFVCPKTAVEYAEKKNLLPYEELSLYVIHGILHCLGFDDLEPAKKRIMRKKEKRCMDFIKIKDLVLKP